MKLLSSPLLIAFVSSLFALSAGALESSVVINEIAWMGTTNSANDEWIELYNPTDTAVNLDNWTLKSTDDNLKINLKGTIAAKGFFLLERTDDSSVPDVAADLIYTGALNNQGTNLKLFDSNNKLIDEVDDSSGWLGGDNETKQTAERKIDASWQTSQNPGGTPKKENGVLNKIETQSIPTPTTSQVQTIIPEEKTVYPSGIVINEILPSPAGPDETNEWIEIFNQNNFSVDLSNWRIFDMVGSVKTYVFPTGTKILPENYLVLARPVSKIVLNNDADGLKLCLPDGQTIDEVVYEKAPLGKSYNRTENNDWVWSSSLTPGLKNIVETKATLVTVKETSETDKTEANGLADISQTLEPVLTENSPQSFPVILIAALTVAIFSGFIILILKNKTRKK